MQAEIYQNHNSASPSHAQDRRINLPYRQFLLTLQTPVTNHVTGTGDATKQLFPTLSLSKRDQSGLPIRVFSKLPS